ncbi:hypothetical protein ACFQNE_06800 [Gordonia phosphorivorans]|uniref:Low molecular weight antigen MTB12-like C-terminal domain-containing protein n=1 Tax=Gordonia phosphorivorans TaxID=1056982 RepID=A0ABV6H4V8_9ACTN
MKYRKFLVIGSVAAMLSVTAACGSDDNALPPVPPAPSSTSAAAGGEDSDLVAQLSNAKKRPTVDALNEMLTMALDPDVPAADKVDLVEGAEADPKLFDQLVKVAKENPDVSYEIKKPVVGNGPKRASVKVEVKLPDNPPTMIDAAIVYDDGRWKLAKSTVCPLLEAGDVKSPLCADQGATKSKSAKSTSKSAN